jgi:predicted RNA-binding protein with PIN domain
MRWLIDGMNVIGSRPDGWWRDRHDAMARLVLQLERWAAATGDEVVVVFERPPTPAIASSTVDVAGAPRGGAHAADDEIARRVRAAADPAAIRVVTSDRGLADRVRAAGAAVEPARAFRGRLEAL